MAGWRLGRCPGVALCGRRSAGQALCLDFDFAGVAGYASARRVLSIDFPLNYEFAFYVRGDAPVNNLEFKLSRCERRQCGGSTTVTLHSH